MAKCECCGKGVTFGIKVSHSHRRSNRTWKPNVRRVKASWRVLPSISTHAPAACALAKSPALSKLMRIAGHFVEWPAFYFISEHGRKQTMALPSDPIMLLSVVNLKLRDFYPSLDALCDDMDADKDALCKALSAVGYAYDAARNQFI